VKSVSTLWAVADPAVAAVIEQAHQAAVNDALAFLEQHALFTRTGIRADTLANSPALRLVEDGPVAR
jgi:TrwC relaxase